MIFSNYQERKESTKNNTWFQNSIIILYFLGYY